MIGPPTGDTAKNLASFVREISAVTRYDKMKAMAEKTNKMVDSLSSKGFESMTTELTAMARNMSNIKPKTATGLSQSLGMMGGMMFFNALSKISSMFQELSGFSVVSGTLTNVFKIMTSAAISEFAPALEHAVAFLTQPDNLQTMREMGTAMGGVITSLLRVFEGVYELAQESGALSVLAEALNWIAESVDFWERAFSGERWYDILTTMHEERLERENPDLQTIDEWLEEHGYPTVPRSGSNPFETRGGTSITINVEGNVLTESELSFLATKRQRF